MTRLWTCSPVATRIGATARAIVAWPRMSSGLVGSSIQYGSNSASAGHPVDRLVDAPALVRVDRQHRVRADLLAHDPGAPPVVLDVRADLELEPRPALGQRLAAQPADLVVVVAQPADRRRVGRIAVAAELRLARGPRRRRAPGAGRARAPASGRRRCTGSRRARRAPRASCRRAASRAACPRSSRTGPRPR